MSNKEIGKIMFFDKDKNGLHVAPSSDISNGACLLSAVEESKKLCSKTQVAGEEKAENLYKVIVYPSLRDHKHAMQSNQIKNVK